MRHLRPAVLFLAAALLLCACGAARDRVDAGWHDTRSAAAAFSARTQGYLAVGTYAYGTVTDHSPASYSSADAVWNTSELHDWEVRLDSGHLVRVQQAGTRLHAGQRVLVIRQALHLRIIP